MNSETGSISCWLVVENLQSVGQAASHKQYKNVNLSLGRNEFRDIIFIVNFGKRRDSYIVRDPVIFHKFVKDGKATIKLPGEKMQFLISNCPPDRLMLFLKTLHTKFVCLKNEPTVTARERLQSQRHRTCQEISPLVLKDLQNAQNILTNRTKAAEDKLKPGYITPIAKRKRINIDVISPSENKENITPTGPKKKLGRKALTQQLSAVRSAPMLIQLSKEQLDILNVVTSGRNLFFTGSAGTGKSFLLKRIIGALPPDHTFATASTGVAACHIGGTTIHSFAGIGSGKAPLEQCIQLAGRPQVAQQWRKCNHLIIDEISMINADFFEKLEAVARVVRRNDSPFGGIQIILSGDFLQLPPVTKDNEKRRFCFQSSAWKKSVDINMELKEVKRQSDSVFIDVLNNIRYGRCPEVACKVLEASSAPRTTPAGIVATRLCTHKDDVDQINRFQLNKLTGERRMFEASDSDPIYQKWVDAHCPVPHKLELAVGAQVMCTKNLDVTRGMVNGARGVVTAFERGDHGHPIVRFVCGVSETIKPVRWSFKRAPGLVVSRCQVPLQLAWAISIHKSQGMSLDCVEMSLSKVFECGQAYVALSRAKSLEGLRVLDFDRSCVRANPDVLKFYHNLDLHQRMYQGDIRSFTAMGR